MIPIKKEFCNLRLKKNVLNKGLSVAKYHNLMHVALPTELKQNQKTNLIIVFHCHI